MLNIDAFWQMIGFDTAFMRGLIGSFAAEVLTYALILIAIVMLVLAIILPLSLLVMRSLDNAKLNTILRRMLE
jgi:hypothetical protein